MGKMAMIDEIITVFDQLEETKRELKYALQSKNEENFEHGDLSTAEKNILEVGRAKVFADSMACNFGVSAVRDDEIGIISVTHFEEWQKSKILYLPDYFSFDSFTAYFNRELKELYEQQKALAIEVLEADEDVNEPF